MVERQIHQRGVSDARVLEAMRRIPREDFVPEDLRDEAYADRPLAIGEGQTISQPYIVARMAEAARLSPDDRVLEVGAGSGYSAAVLASLAGDVHTIERHPALAMAAARRLAEAGIYNAHVHLGDGSVGFTAKAPFDAIVVTAAGPRVPETLLAQLAPGGRLVMPVGAAEGDQTLVRITRGTDGPWRREDLGAVRFVPLLGREGW
jgi:protein-L-isoaspartate(D-aspartate) O-methyltransferase